MTSVRCRSGSTCRSCFGAVIYGRAISFDSQHLADVAKALTMFPVQVLIRPEILPGGQLADSSTWSTPQLEVAPGFKAPLPTSFEALHEYIEHSLPAESPVVYGMHPNAELSLLTSLGETLFKTITLVSGGGAGVYCCSGLLV